MIFGQDKSLNRDTLILEIENKIIVKVSSFENGWIKYYDGFNTRIMSFQEDLQKIQKKIPIDRNYKLISKQIGVIEVLNSDEIKKIKISDTILIERPHEAQILSSRFDIYFYFNQLSDLISLNIQDLVNKAVENQAKQLMDGGWVDYSKGKHHGIAWTMKYICLNDSISFYPQESHYNANKSQLSLKIGIGAGLIKNQLASDFNFRIGKFNTCKGILKHHFYISDNLNYTFDDSETILINNFLNLGYRYNLSNSLNKYNWIGVECGYLTKVSGDFFKNPTFRLGTMIDLRQNITISPQIYFENGFNKVYPGLRIGIDIGP